jgi:hypothetical protein
LSASINAIISRTFNGMLTPSCSVRPIFDAPRPPPPPVRHRTANAGMHSVIAGRAWPVFSAADPLGLQLTKPIIASRSLMAGHGGGGDEARQGDLERLGEGEPPVERWRHLRPLEPVDRLPVTADAFRDLALGEAERETAGADSPAQRLAAGTDGRGRFGCHAYIM